MWAISGVWLLDSITPLLSMKCSRFGIISRSDGTFGLSRKKWMLSKPIWTTCLMPWPRWQEAAAAARCAGCVTDASPAALPPMAHSPPTSVTLAAAAASLNPLSLLRSCCRMLPPCLPAWIGSAPVMVG